MEERARCFIFVFLLNGTEIHRQIGSKKINVRLAGAVAIAGASTGVDTGAGAGAVRVRVRVRVKRGKRLVNLLFPV